MDEQRVANAKGCRFLSGSPNSACRGVWPLPAFCKQEIASSNLATLNTSPVYRVSTDSEIFVRERDSGWLAPVLFCGAGSEFMQEKTRWNDRRQ